MGGGDLDAAGRRRRKALELLASKGDVYLIGHHNSGGALNPFAAAADSWALAYLQAAVKELKVGDYRIGASSFRASASMWAAMLQMSTEEMMTVARWADPKIQVRYARFMREQLVCLLAGALMSIASSALSHAPPSPSPTLCRRRRCGKSTACCPWISCAAWTSASRPRPSRASSRRRSWMGCGASPLPSAACYPRRNSRCTTPLA